MNIRIIFNIITYFLGSVFKRFSDLTLCCRKMPQTPKKLSVEVNLVFPNAAPYLPNYVFHQRFVNTPIFRKILILKFEKISCFW